MGRKKQLVLVGEVTAVVIWFCLVLLSPEGTDSPKDSTDKTHLWIQTIPPGVLTWRMTMSGKHPSLKLDAQRTFFFLNLHPKHQHKDYTKPLY